MLRLAGHSLVALPVQLVLVALGSAPAAQVVRVNPLLPRDPGLTAEDVFSFQVSPDGQWAVFLADPEQNDRFELFAVPADGSGVPRRLNPPLVPGGSLVRVWQWPYEERRYQHAFLHVTADGRVVYGGDQEYDERFELFVVPLDGSAAALKLNGPEDVVWDWAPRFFAVSEPAGRVVYVRSGGHTELFSAPLDASAPPVRLSAPVATGGDVTGSGWTAFVLAPDGQHVVYRAGPLEGPYELWSTPIDGSRAPVQLSHASSLSASVLGQDFRVSPDGARVVYLALHGDGVRLWSVPLDGSAAPVQLNGALPSGGGVSIGELAFSPDSTRVYYCADQETDGRVDLYAVPLVGGPSVRLAAALQVPGVITDIQCAPDGGRVVYRGPQAGAMRLWSVHADGSAAPVELGGSLVAGGHVTGHDISADGRHVVYTADQTVDDRQELWSVPIEGGQPAVRLNGPLVAGGDVLADQLTLGSDGTVLYLADQRVDGLRELWSVPIDRSRAPVRMNGALQPNGNVMERSELAPETGFALTADGQRVLYRADQATDELFALYSVPLDRSQPPVELNQVLTGGAVRGDVLAFAWAGNAARLVYSADQEVDADYGVHLARLAPHSSAPPALVRLGDGLDLRVSPSGAFVAFRPPATCEPAPYCSPSAPLWCRAVDGSTPSVEIGPGLGGHATSVLFTPDESRLVFGQFAPSYRYSSQGLFSAPLLGGAPVSLTEPPGMQPEPWALLRLALDPTGARAVYVYAHQASHLVSVPVDRGQPPLDLTGPVDYPGVAPEFALTPDGTRAVFVAALERPEVEALYQVALDGAFGPLPLVPSLPESSDVDAGLSLTPDGTRVLFVADLENDEVFELWSAALAFDRVEPLVRLSAKPVPGGDVARAVMTSDEGVRRPQFALDPAARRVVYRADQELDEVHELFSAPLDGRTPPVRLNAPLGPAQDVALFGFRIAPDGAHVAYVADQETPGVLELFAAPLDGSVPPWKLGGPAVAGGGVWLHPRDGAAPSLAFTPDGRQLVFLGDLRTDGVVELFLVPVDGSAPPRVLNAPLGPGGNVASLGNVHAPFLVSPDGRRVAYQADATFDEAYELFVAELDPAHVQPARRRLR
ncbi:MAG TPA: hypothetical protein VF530_03265 [Planctomycetota bacterium]